MSRPRVQCRAGGASAQVLWCLYETGRKPRPRLHAQAPRGRKIQALARLDGDRVLHVGVSTINGMYLGTLAPFALIVGREAPVLQPGAAWIVS